MLTMLHSTFRFIGLLTLLVLTACGGGGSAGTPSLGGGGSGTTGASVSLAVSSTSISVSSPATLTVTVRDAAGAPVAGSVVTLSMERGDIAQLSSNSLLTDANGMGTVGLVAAASGVTGADQVTATVNLGTTTISSKIGFGVTGGSATLQAAIDSTTLRLSAGPVRFSATVRNAAGAPMAGQIVAFGSASGLVKLAAVSALTDSAGVASTTVTPADGSVGVADTVVASTVVNGKALQSSVNVQVVSETPSLAITLVGASSVSFTNPVTVLAAVRDASNQPVAGAVVSFSTQFGLGAFNAATAATAASTGVATVTLAPKTIATSGADYVVASVTINGVTKTVQRVVEFVASAPPVNAALQMSISSTTVTPLAPANVSMTLLDSSGRPVPGAVISLSTVRANIGVLSATSVLTGAQGTAGAGTATVQLQASTSGTTGADEVVAVATVLGVAVQGRVGYTVQATAPTISVAISPATTLRQSSGPATVTATVRDAAGVGVANQIVKFSSAGGLVKLSAPSATTNASGAASVTALPADASLTAAEAIVATATLSGIDLRGSAAVQLQADSPSLHATLSSSNVTPTSPATLSVVVRDTNGNPVAGSIVSLSTLFGLGAFDAATVATNASGVASVVVSPKTPTSNGADLIVASATVGGVVASAQAAVQFTNSGSSGTPVLQLTLSSSSISSAAPASVTARLTDSKGLPVAGQVVTFGVVRGLAVTNVGTALTDASGNAVVVLSPSTSTTAGADEVTATASFAGAALQATKGFQVQATNVTLTGFTSAVASLGAYGQTVLTINLTGASVGSPVNVNVTSSCVAQNKATLSPSTFTATTGTVELQYKDSGCGALQSSDQLQATIVGSANSRTLSLPIGLPTASSLAFVSALPNTIFLKGSGFAETSTVTFEVRDGAGNTLPNRDVVLSLLTQSGGVTMEGGTANVTRASDAFGRVSVRVNSGTVPTPIRIAASLASTPAISTVSSSLSVAVGLPSQLNFSLSQQTLNIEGYNIDGTPNTYSIIAADRSGNPVPAGTSINFITEGGQIEAIKQTQLLNGLARTSAGFVSAEPRPVDGRVTVTVYALGEESFIDQNGNNSWDPGEPFQDLGNVFKDRVYDGLWDSVIDEYVPLQINNSSACAPLGHALLALNPSMPTIPGTCDGIWSGAGKVYVRRAVETVFSTSAARPMWGGTSGLTASCLKTTLQNGPQPANTGTYTQVESGDTWYTGGPNGGALVFLAGDANPIRFNPMAAGTTLSATTPTTGLTVTIAGGSPVPSSSEVTSATVAFEFAAGSGGSGLIFVTFTSPSGVGTTFRINVTTASRPSACP